ncbi:ankyrin repeats (many copies) domain-containing protein [Hirsutella rhossiliensis]|uniref:Ankyrin repeats (Many copies) domain-containing protein n=1 Tax=Hirsutella rhossiliensis TaxID=111463 RepID=A0A9P8N8N7_9HYPO|nr:ankyrin repeats (many copies) domain-containing protein [Hirsutella rhossiliensis]KAH0968021.1 ankyrin repeats (many copies) domain-containing protein [Hirsutella rhossiliensis]
MAPHLTEDEIDDLVYFARAGENVHLDESLAALADREKVSPAEILLGAKDEGKSSTLHMAAGNGHLGTVRRLLDAFQGRPKEEKQAFIDEANEHGNTGLHWAALGGHLDAVKLLLEHGASPALANERNYVPLDLANFNDKTEVTQYFLSFSGGLESSNQENGLSSAAESVELVDDEAQKDEISEPPQAAP